MDILNTMLNEKLNLTAQEYEEWGNPRSVPEYFNENEENVCFDLDFICSLFRFDLLEK